MYKTHVPHMDNTLQFNGTVHDDDASDIKITRLKQGHLFSVEGSKNRISVRAQPDEITRRAEQIGAAHIDRLLIASQLFVDFEFSDFRIRIHNFKLNLIWIWILGTMITVHTIYDDYREKYQRNCFKPVGSM
ncbi:hypothetical protein BATDEDRAFT_23202 [Batrachochytrium dendrobatidis JAM81]|uniref:Uncharacterized protein n=1 Tax=Batrachochytrium dendrobatidis (strain JAM81 / FGSC 10211) TaxID=684364 RepID=F4NX15_BATDJ|nr:uncharacterized protein BATDEDRAFT_23202 [Batrachochytrium dendrobatidis JAM81]XP_006678391.1 uncharacterized protein BATDEDRAFT_24287 [Batrachochytrium dendrobatidis JAM81]XP_006679405.1 uncharacterized protein BATDEDRAFT_25250 [Batrachochytrium dendrobatidis JAM81]XP_006680433.1 uncharacterized protein BATDEDRAFT_35613 [Batrachochytrium dendrobatidis JAM81]XP_006681965.1 uncharacterized protein BATDEDRAFT_27775 [Batrachochytrium dendrobatidis JAM81]XP_006682154.1 uncharacterized protein B|eukprot:XP_006676730.1 hypothetical protein BATDEDRAFT_23202 [Batrachochytrium dendrobatidis JAM81]